MSCGLCALCVSAFSAALRLNGFVSFTAETQRTQRRREAKAKAEDPKTGGLHGNRYRAEMNLLVRSDLDSRALLGQVRNELGAIDPTIPVFNVRTLDEQVQSVASQERATALTTTLFGGLALLLATIGLYGVLSYTVVQRTREIGIRMALGARTADVFRLVLTSGMTLAFAGVALGVVIALALTRVIRSFLFGITTTDVLTFTTVAAGLIVVALLACLIPARRAARVDPVVALKAE